MTTHVLYEGAPEVIVRSDTVIMEGADVADVVAAARRAAATAARIELCGGLPTEVAAQVRESVDAGIEVRVNRYGFESLEQAAA